MTMAVLKKLGWDKDLTAEELATITKIGGNNIDAVSWAIDLSGGIQRVCLDHGVMHYGNGKARANAWNLPDPMPVHREPVYSPRPDLVAKYPTRPDERQFRLPNIGFSVQKSAVDKNIAKEFPMILSSGRLVEYEGGGEETRSNPWLAELQQEMFVEINTADAADRGIRDGQWVWVYGAENGAKVKVKALVTERVGRGVAWMPFHFSGWYQGDDMRRIIRRARTRSFSERASTRSRLMASTPSLACRSPKPPCARSVRPEGGNNGPDEIPLRLGPVHRMQCLRDRLQERT